MIQEKNVIMNGRDVFYLLKQSSQPKATIVFIHGFPFSSEMWRNQLEILPEEIEGFAFDIRGFGRSKTNHPFFSIDLFARDLFDFLDAVKVDKALLCGLSMGGYITLRAAQINKERIAGIILCDTNSVADSDESKLKRFSSIDLVAGGNKRDFALGFLKNIFCESTFENNPDAIQLIENIILNTSESTICAAQLALASRTDTSSVLQSLNIPALIIRGEQDKIMTPEQAKQLHSSLKESELLIVPHAGHMSNLENPSVFNTALLDFLSKHFQ